VSKYDDVLAQLSAETPEPNRYDLAAQDLARQRNTMLRSSIFEALQSNPDQFAKARKLSTETNIPAPVVERNLDTVQRQASLSRYDKMLSELPALRDHMARPEFAKLAHDDLDNAQAIEMLFRRPSMGGATGVGARAGRSVASALGPRIAEGVYGVGEAASETSALLFEPLTRALQLISPVKVRNPAGRAAELYRDLRHAAAKQAEQIRGDMSDAGFIERSVYGGFESFGQNIPLLIGGALTRNPQLTLTGMSGLVFGQEYGTARDEDVPVAQAATFALSQAAVEYATETIPVGRLLGDLEKQTGFMRTLLGQVATEIPQEQAATILQDLNQWATLNPERPFADYLSERPSAAAQTLISTLVAVGAQTTTVQAVDATARYFSGQDARAELANANAERLAQLAQAAAASKLRGRAPDTFEQFVQQAAEQEEEMSDVYVDARAFGDVLEQAGIDPMEVSKSVAAQYAEASNTGGDLRIPVGEFAARIAGEDYAQALLPHLRASPEAMSAAEAQEFQQGAADQFRAEAEKVMAAQEENDAFQESATSVETILREQLTAANRFTGDVNNAYAAFMRDFYIVTAQKLGVTPEEMYKRYPLRVTAEPLAEGLEQLAPEQFEVDESADGEQFVIRGGEVARMEADVVGDTLQIKLSEVHRGQRGEGIGQQLIQQAYEVAQTQGKRLVSDRAVSAKQLRAYEGLRRKGWTIEYADPVEVQRILEQADAFERQGEDLAALGVSAPLGEAVVTRIEPPRPAASARLADANVPAPAPGTTRFRHFGNVVTDVLDPTFMGTGMPGAERARDPVQSIALYPDEGFVRESGVGPNEFVVDVPTDQLYDASADPAGLLDESRVATSFRLDEQGNRIPTNTQVDFSEFERRVRDAGFVGYTTPEAEGNLRGQARIFTQIPVEGVDESEAEQLVERAAGVLFQLAPEQEPQGFGAIKPHLAEDERAAMRRDTAAKLVQVFKDLPKDADFMAAALAGEAKRGWYAAAVRTLRQVFGDADAPRFAALMAALSPQVPVDTNLAHAVRAWTNWDRAGRPADADTILDILDQSVYDGRPGQALGAWKNNTVRALSAELPSEITLSGPKVNSFMRNLSGDVNEVTNDTWMANFALIDQTLFAGQLTKTRGPGKRPGYAAMNAKIRRVAARLTKETGETWTPSEVQETVWSWAKTAVELADAAGETRSVEQLVREGAITDEHVARAPDFSTMFAQDATIRGILEGAGYGEAIEAIELEFGGRPARRGAGAATVSPGLLRSARRLDALRRQRVESERATRERRDDQPEAARRTPEHQPGSPLGGLPESSLGPLAAIQEAAQRYLDEVLVNNPDLPSHTRYVRASPERGARIAQAYEEAQHNPDDFEVQVAYDALIDETLAQYQVVKELGLTIEFIPPGQNPYPEGPRQVFEDIRRGHLWTFPTEQGFGTETEGAGHPLLRPTDERIGDHQLVANDVFRIVHDIFGHAKEGNGFGPNGEENAWHSHVRMYSPLAARAMTTETRGQNSWVNFGPFGEQNRANQQETVYAEQKAALLPEWVMADGLLEGSEPQAEAATFEQQREPSPEGLAGANQDLIGDAAATGLTELAQGQTSAPRGQIQLDGEGGATIALLRNADLSTFLHESGHFFLEVYADIVAQPDAPPAIADDFSKILAWFGVDSPQTWQSMTLEQRRPHHEQFARGFEAYLFEGNAPTSELSPIFSRFRAWLINVYKTLTHLNVELTDEVRGVFGRLVASDQAIAATEAARAFAPLFESAEQAGMTEDEWQTYQEATAAATTDATDTLQRRSLRDMRWLSNAKSRVLGALQKDALSKRESLRAEAAEEVAAEPIYRVIRWLARGEMEQDGEIIKATAGHKLSVDALNEMYPEGELGALDWSALRPQLASGTGTQHPDTIAQLFGFTSGDHLVRALLAVEPRESVVEAVTDRKMLERYGDLTDFAALERAADEAVHNEARARFVATEIRALNRMLNARGRTPAGGTFNVMLKAAKDFAAITIARRRIRDVRPAQFTAAETRAAKAADRELVAGNLLEAATEKRNQLINTLAARAAFDALNEIERGLRFLKKFENEGTRKNLDGEYLEQIDSLLERFDLRKGTTARAAAKRKSLLEWVESQRELGFEPSIDETLLAEARRQPYKELTVEEFRGLIDTVKNIEHLGRLKKKLLTAVKDREFAEAVETAETSVRENARKTIPDELEHNAFGARLKEGVKEFFAMHRKFASIVRQMDGFKDGGALWELFIRPLNAAGDREAVAREQATKQLTALFRPIVKGSKLRRKLYIPEIGRSLSREGRLVIALNQGNETNRLRVMEGDRWSQPQVGAILDTLTKDDWDFVQSVWDHVDSFWPEISAKEKRVTGLTPEKVEATPVQTKFGEYRGGYYPIKYDTRRSSRAEADTLAESLRQSMQGLYTRATTRRGHTKARVESVKRPMRKDFGVLFEHVNQVIHDLSFHEYLIDATRLLSSLDGVIREHHGRLYLKQMSEALKDVARGDIPAQDSFEAGLNHIRTGATIAGLGWNMSTAALQPLGLTQSIVRVGPEWVARGLGRWLGSARGMENSVAWVRQKSSFMRLRAKTMQREINEVQNEVRGMRKLDRVQASFFWLIQQAQVAADMPTWLGAYEKAMAHETDEARAIALADQAVLDSQGGGQIKDLARIQRGGPMMKLWTNFYSFFNTTYNLAAESILKTEKKPADVGRLAVDYLLLFSIPAVLSMLVKEAFGRGDDDDEMLAKMAKAQVSYLMGTVIGARDFGGMVEGFPYRGPAGLRGLDEIARLIEQAEQREVDAAALRALNATAGILFHYPAGQVQRTVEGVVALSEGDTENPAALAAGHRD
jgi:GNAT superfamily N-acetyltransferase